MISRRTLLQSVTAGAMFGVAGCTENNEPGDIAMEPAVAEAPPVAGFDSTPNGDNQTYTVTVTGAPNRADYINIEHDGDLVHTIDETISDPVEVVDDAADGDLMRAIAVTSGSRETIEETEVG